MNRESHFTTEVKILHMCNVDEYWKFFSGNITFIHDRGMCIGICSPHGKRMDHALNTEKIDACFAIDMAREINPLHDVVSIFNLYRMMRKFKPTIVVAGGPKGAFLGMISSFLAGVPIRIYFCHGLRLETTRGIKRTILSCTEKLTCFLSHRIWSVSQSLEENIVSLGFTPKTKIRTILHGTANGIDLKRFHRTADQLFEQNRIRRELGWSEHDPVIGFIGRMTKDKGITELTKAFQRILSRYPSAKLLLVGPREAGDAVPEEVVTFLEKHPNVSMTGSVDDPVVYYGLMDLLALPSYREGLPTVVLEASAMGVPTVGANCTGMVDALVDNETGIMVPVADDEKLAEGILRYLDDDELRLRHGNAGIDRIARDFYPPSIWRGYFDDLVELLHQKRIAFTIVTDETAEALHDEAKKTKEWIAAHNCVHRNISLEKCCSIFGVAAENISDIIADVRFSSRTNQLQTQE